MKTYATILLSTLVAALAACQSAPSQQTAAQAATPAAVPDTEVGRPVADAENLPAPSGDPHDDAPSVDVPTTTSPLVLNSGATFTATANGLTWVPDSVEAFSGPDLLGQHEELTLRFRVGLPGQVGSRLVLRLPLTPENVANMPVRIPLASGLRGELSGSVRGTGSKAQLWDSGDLKTGNATGFEARSFGQPQGSATIEALDRAGRVVDGQVDATFPADGSPAVSVHLRGTFRQVRY
ncbi:hypothetical protein [Solirubrum puertoriconensis]|uniref:Uncharacterized protein n=1 Tax=Solirubrum puertoriconensis TaxID=1751427 RepID=A0A9X0HPF5_SOLP1|nr:hypothetical protein [Solirubrum puertoriconensis]KUG09685.1 hypothetical protein ASU33_18535 [Solirubrum puertoriconensis]